MAFSQDNGKGNEKDKQNETVKERGEKGDGPMMTTAAVTAIMILIVVTMLSIVFLCLHRSSSNG